MKSEDIYNSITDINDGVIERADRPAKKRRVGWAACAAVILVAAMIGGIIAVKAPANVTPETAPVFTSSYAVAEAVMPATAPYPNDMDYTRPNGTFDSDGYDKAFSRWLEVYKTQTQQPEDYTDGLVSFTAKSAAQFLSDTGSVNSVYSPINVYLALGMLAELTDGNSRQQVLDLVGADGIDALRESSSSLWNANYADDGVVTSLLGSSLWLDNGKTFEQDTLDRLAQYYFASSYQGEMGSEEFSQALRDWLNTNTGGLLEDQISDLGFSPDAVLGLATSIYFKDAWANKFNEALNTEDVFHTPDGDVTAAFMHSSGAQQVYFGDKFMALESPMQTRRSMWLLLPDEGVEAEDLLSDTNAVSFMLAKNKAECSDAQFSIVNLSMPKFDVSSDFSLIDGLQELGVTDVFDGAVSDFSPMTKDGSGYAVSQATHAARVTVDEEGCEAAAFTLMAVSESAPIAESIVDFTLDRPFVFVITGPESEPLFIGVVNTPNE